LVPFCLGDPALRWTLQGFFPPLAHSPSFFWGSPPFRCSSLPENSFSQFFRIFSVLRLSFVLRAGEFRTGFFPHWVPPRPPSHNGSNAFFPLPPFFFPWLRPWARGPFFFGSVDPPFPFMNFPALIFLPSASLSRITGFVSLRLNRYPFSFTLTFPVPALTVEPRPGFFEFF